MRLEHVSTPVLSHIPSISHHISETFTKTRPICPLAKQTNLPYNPSSSHASHIFDLIHVDLWGPYFLETSQGFRFFLTIVDDHFRAVWTFLLPSKKHDSHQLIQFISYVEIHFQTTIKTFQSDHGTEFFNQTLTSFFLTKGIVQQASCADTPAQNGGVERKYIQLLAIARSLNFQSSVHVKLWGECILAATFIIDRIPTPILDNETPFESLHKCLPDYTVFKVFSCFCYASIHDSDKFFSLAIRCVFLGYPHDHKGFKLLDLATQKQFIFRHVVFHETVFSFLHKSKTVTPSDPSFAILVAF